MKQLRTALARIAGVFTDRRADDDLREELQAHLDMETAENIRRGGDAHCPPHRTDGSHRECPDRGADQG